MAPFLALVGPTASGKTEVSIRMAEAVGAEILSVDSMLVYRGMDVGTAKQTAEQRERVPHHLLDLVDPSESFNVAEFQSAAHGRVLHVGCSSLKSVGGGDALCLNTHDRPERDGAD